MSFIAFTRYTEIPGDQPRRYEGPWAEEQRGEYESGLVRINDELWRIRTARVTPTKPGAFVAVWRRDERGETLPFGHEETITGLMVFVEDGDHFGVFRFSSSDLQSLGITTSGQHPGKRGFRVYPSWCTQLNAQATRTQAAQASAFALLV